MLVLVKSVHRVMLANTVKVKKPMGLLPLTQRNVLVVLLVGLPNQAVQNVNRVKLVRSVQLWVKFVNHAMRANTVNEWKTMVKPLQTQPFASVAPRVGRPKQAVQDVSRVKRVLLVLMWVKIVKIVVLVNFVPVKMMMALSPTPPNVFFVQLGTIPIRGVQNVNSAVPEHTTTSSVERNVKRVH